MLNIGRAEHDVVLTLRRGLATSADHIQALLDLGMRIHFVTVETEDVETDPRFSSVILLPEEASHDECVRSVVELAREKSAAAVVTFIETDIIVVETAKQRLGMTATPEAARICRDKLRQRLFLEEHGIPTVWFSRINDVDGALEAAGRRGLPLIVKPTRASGSENVELVATRDRLRQVLEGIRNLAGGRRGFYSYYYDDAHEHWAIMEDYLPGREVTLDGVVLDGEFVAGGVHDKLHSSGPFFEEDLYTLPFATPEREDELVGIARRIVQNIGVSTCLFNAELREDADGRFRVVEFSIRVSGGHVYRQIRDVYSIDLVRMFARRARGEPTEAILAQETRRRDPRMAVCAKVIYADGEVSRNSVGAALHSPNFRAYYPVAKPGARVAAAPRGFDVTGLLSVWAPWRPGQDPSCVHSVAHDLAEKLDLEVRDPQDHEAEQGSKPRQKTYGV